MIRATFVSAETSLNAGHTRHHLRSAPWLRSRNSGWCGKRVTEGRSGVRIADDRCPRRREFFPLFCQRDDSDHQKPRYQVQHISRRFRSEMREIGRGRRGG